MNNIIIPKRDLSLDNIINKQVSETLTSLSIDEDYYKSKIQPFYESLYKEYEVAERLITQYGFKRKKFVIPDINLVQTKKFLEGEKSLEIKIQDMVSYNTEEEITRVLKEQNLNPNDPLIKNGLIYAPYKRQTGVLIVEQDSNQSYNTLVKLNNVELMSVTRPRKQQSRPTENSSSIEQI